jgi:hypothetical protein
MSLPQAIKSMLGSVGSVATTNITYGTRNEFGTLPAITYSVTSNETIAVGSAPLRKASIQFQSVAETAEDAQALAETLEANLATGTYNSITFCAFVNMNSVLQEASASFGEETEPFICITTADIYYEE